MMHQAEGRRGAPHIAVDVRLDGEELVCIETNCLSGKADLSPSEEAAIEQAARMLLGFVGK